MHKIIRITLIASLVYYIYNIIIAAIEGREFPFPFYSIYDVLIWVVFGFNFSGPLWYMTALCWTLLIIIILYKLGWQKLLYLTPLAFILYNIILAYPLRDITLPWYFETNFISSGLPWVSVGMFIKKYETNLDQTISNKAIWIALFVAIVLRHIEQYYFVGAEPRAMINIPLVVIIFLLCLRYKSFGEGSLLSKLGKTYSTNIYLYHSLIGGALLFAGKQIGFSVPDSICALIVYALTLALSICIANVKTKLQSKA